MAQLTEQQFIDSLRKKMELLKKENLPLKIAAQSVHALRIKRIFHDGRKSTHRKIGVYDTTRELWVSDDQLRRKGTNKGKYGDPTETSYYENYKALKKQQGFDDNFVNLRMTNNLQSEFANKKISASNNSIPSDAEVEEINKERYVERVDNEDKVEALENKYGKIFEFSKIEKKKFKKIYSEEALKILEG